MTSKKKTADTKTKTTKTAKTTKSKKTNKQPKDIAQATTERLILTLKTGEVVIEFYEELAPNHVERIKTLTKQGFYDGVPFHRVIDGFMAQTGDPTGTGSGGSDLPDLKSEFNTKAHRRGSVSMARAAHPHSANSQFFIVYDDAPWLDRQYTLWGKVISGMEFIDDLPKGKDSSGMVDNPAIIVKAEIK